MESISNQAISDEQKNELLMNSEIGSRVVPISGEQVPGDCEEGWGTWSPTKDVCVLCPYAGACFCRATNTPPRVVAMSRKQRQVKSKGSTKMDQNQNNGQTNDTSIADKFASIGFGDGVASVQDVKTILLDNMKGRAKSAKILKDVRNSARQSVADKAFDENTVEDHQKLLDYHRSQAESATDPDVAAAHRVLARAHERTLELT